MEVTEIVRCGCYASCDFTFVKSGVPFEDIVPSIIGTDGIKFKDVDFRMVSSRGAYGGWTASWNQYQTERLKLCLSPRSCVIPFKAI